MVPGFVAGPTLADNDVKIPVMLSKGSIVSSDTRELNSVFVAMSSAVLGQLRTSAEVEGQS